MLNAGKLIVFCPSVTLIVMFPYVPTLALVGVPLSVPVVVLDGAQEGRPAMLKLIGRLDGPAADGVKVYSCPAAACVAGVPLIHKRCLTQMLNAGSEADR